MSTFGQIQTSVQEMLGRIDSDTNAKILLACNTVQRLLGSNGSWEDLERVSSDRDILSGVNEYVLRTWLVATTFMKIKNIQVMDGANWAAPMTQLTSARWDRDVAPHLETSSNTPTHFTVFQRTLQLYPKPDQDYVARVKYYVKPTELTGADSNLSFDDMYDPLISHATTGFVWMYLEEMDLAERFMTTADTFLNEFRAFNDKIFNFTSFISHKNTERAGSSDPWANPFQKQLR